MEINDHDNDNVPSYLEDLNGNLNLTDDADDTDGDTFYDFVDSDDDNDGTLTIDEDLEPDTDLSVDRDGDGDPTNDIGDGDPTNDDTDGDGIPNYLDPDDSDSRNDRLIYFLFRILSTFETIASAFNPYLYINCAGVPDSPNVSFVAINSCGVGCS